MTEKTKENQVESFKKQLAQCEKITDQAARDDELLWLLIQFSRTVYQADILARFIFPVFRVAKPTLKPITTVMFY
jgi:hypothetical protein